MKIWSGNTEGLNQCTYVKELPFSLLAEVYNKHCLVFMFFIFLFMHIVDVRLAIDETSNGHGPTCLFKLMLFNSKWSTGQVTTNSSAPVSSVSLSVPAQRQHGVSFNLAIGRVSGSLETWMWDPCRNKIENTSACYAHDQVVKLDCISVSFLFNKRSFF